MDEERLRTFPAVQAHSGRPHVRTFCCALIRRKTLHDCLTGADWSSAQAHLSFVEAFVRYRGCPRTLLDIVRLAPEQPRHVR